MKQTTLDLERRSEPPFKLGPEQRRRLVELMASAILAAHQAGEQARAEADDDDARE